MNNSDAMQKISDLQEQIRILENQEKQLHSLVIGFDGKKELGSSLFLIGSLLLFVSVVYSPACISLVSVVILIGGVIVFIGGYRNEKKTQEDIARTVKQINRMRHELKS